MSDAETIQFKQLMDAMAAHYKPGVVNEYVLPLRLPNSGAETLMAFAAGANPSGDLATILGKAETSLSSYVQTAESTATAAVKAFEAGGGINALVRSLKAQEISAKTQMDAIISGTYQDLITFGTSNPQAQPHILQLTKQLGGFLTNFLNSMGDYFNKLAADIVTWSHKVVYESAWAGISHWFSGAVRSIGQFFTKLGADAVKAFEAIADEAKAAWDDAKALVEKAIAAGEKAILEPIAKAVTKGLPVADLREAWKKVSASNAADISTVTTAAKNKSITPAAQTAMANIREQMGPSLGNFHKQAQQNLTSAAIPIAVANNNNTSSNPSFLSFGLEVQATGAYVVGAEGGLGMLIGIPDGDGAGYGSVGITLGAEVGAEADIALCFKTGAPKDTGGVYVGIVLSLEVEVGGTIMVFFNFPKFEFTGITVGVGAGAEVAVAVDGGYTFIF